MKKATPKVMKLLDPATGLMQCKVCGARHHANIEPGAHRFYRGSWQCQNGCKLEPDALDALKTGLRTDLEEISKGQPLKREPKATT
jgi:hypothetical protein